MERARAATPRWFFSPGTLAGSWSFLGTNSEDSDYQIIGDQIFCLKLSYLLQTSSTTVQVYNTPNTSGISAGQVGYFNPLQVQAIIVTIAVLDSNSQKDALQSRQPTQGGGARAGWRVACADHDTGNVNDSASQSAADQVVAGQTQLGIE